MTEQDPASGPAEGPQLDAQGRGGHSPASESGEASGGSEGLPEAQPLELAIEAAVRSLLDVIEELAWAAATETKVEAAWAEIVSENFQTHRRELLAADRGGRGA